MKKIIGILSALMLMLVAVGVSAAPFVVNKDVWVTGDWEYDGGWTLPDPAPVTAMYNFDASSLSATVAAYAEIETLGTAWEYRLDSMTDSNSKGWTQSVFNAITVNDPVEYPIVLDTALNGDAYTH